MQSSLGATTFRLFDKVILGVLAVMAAVYLIVAIAGSRSTDFVDPTPYISKIKAVQEASRHVEKTLSVDYLTAAVLQFHPDIKSPTFRQPAVQIEPKLPEELKLVIDPNRPEAGVAQIKIPRRYIGAAVQNDHEDIVKVERHKDKPDVLLFNALGKGTALVRLRQGEREVGSITVQVTTIAPPEPALGVPGNFAADPIQEEGAVRLGWELSGTSNARVTVYNIYRGEDPEKQVLYISVPIPPEPKEEEKPEAVPEPPPPPPPAPDQPPPPSEPEKPAAEKPPETGKPLPTELHPGKQPGPSATLVGGRRIVLTDRTVEGGITYWYSVEAVGEGNDGRRVASAKAGPLEVSVEEPFRIEFYTLSRNSVQIVVSVPYIPAEGEPGERVQKSFISVERGQPVGWKVTKFRWQGKQLEEVDFSTGYQVFDILNDEAVVVEQGGREREDFRQKLLLINERGRIKVLWPGERGQK